MGSRSAHTEQSNNNRVEYRDAIKSMTLSNNLSFEVTVDSMPNIPVKDPAIPLMHLDCHLVARPSTLYSLSISKQRST